MLSLCIFNGKNSLPERHQANFFLNVVNCGYHARFGQIWHLGLNLGVMLKTGSATMAFLVPKQLFSLFSTKICSAFAFNDGKMLNSRTASNQFF